MRIYELRWIFVAFIAGACGAFVPWAFHPATVSAAALQPIKSTRFELIDGAGRTKMAVESDGLVGARLRFFDAEMNTALELGVSSGGKPFVKINGSDGRMRAILRLVEGDKPTLIMGDANTEQRLRLGATQLDTTGSNSDVWALLLGNPIDRDLLVGLAMNTSGEHGAGFGALSVRSSDGKRWDAPLSLDGNRNGKKP